MRGSWLTANLVTIGHHIPKHFPKSPQDLLEQSKPKEPMNKEQWAAMIDFILK